MNQVVYFDLETAGLHEAAPIMQIAAIAIDENTQSEIGTFERKILFDVAGPHVEPPALSLNHYDAGLWERVAVSEPNACAQFAAFLERFRCLQLISKQGRPYTAAKLAGHNAAAFDSPRLRAMFARQTPKPVYLPADLRVRCTMQRAMWWFDEARIAPPKDYKLGTLCEYFGIAVSETHEALADVRLTIQLARALSRPPGERVAA